MSVLDCDTMPRTIRPSHLSNLQAMATNLANKLRDVPSEVVAVSMDQARTAFEGLWEAFDMYYPRDTPLDPVEWAKTLAVDVAHFNSRICALFEDGVEHGEETYWTIDIPRGVDPHEYGQTALRLLESNARAYTDLQMGNTRAVVRVLGKVECLPPGTGTPDLAGIVSFVLQRQNVVVEDAA